MSDKKKKWLNQLIILTLAVFIASVFSGEVVSMAQKNYKTKVIKLQYEGLSESKVEANQIGAYGKKKSHPNKPGLNWKY